MPENFSIRVGINVNILDDEINKWKCAHNYDPIIIVSCSTFKEISTSITTRWYEDNFNCDTCCGRIGRYRGLKVFFDPEKNYGDVELR